jgi:hypothetical protein
MSIVIVKNHGSGDGVECSTHTMNTEWFSQASLNPLHPGILP